MDRGGRVGFARDEGRPAQFTDAIAQILLAKAKFELHPKSGEERSELSKSIRQQNLAHVVPAGLPAMNCSYAGEEKRDEGQEWGRGVVAWGGRRPGRGRTPLHMWSLRDPPNNELFLWKGRYK